ncbi:MAG: diaminopimelate dehydrogenase [Cellvibrionaceae bacterium]|nr:diaminopimelate dehydrogenase [Cellvibrionaceae bacterium]
MGTPIRIGIIGYGNLGRGVELAVAQNRDMTLVGVFSRRDPASVPSQAKVYSIDDIQSFKDLIDVMILCGGSATDLPEQGPAFARHFNTVDSYDTHAKIPEYFERVNTQAVAGGNVSVISTGWDPGLFSLNRLLGQAILPEGTDYTFWGTGVSQGHSDAIRRVAGVKAGVQYTVPSAAALSQVRAGETPALTTREKHKRDCFVVAEEGADQAEIREAIVNMPNYFADYDTTVTFITEDELKRDHAAMPHGGHVFRSGKTGDATTQLMEFSIKLGSNPEFTASVLVAYARAAYKYAQEGFTGAKTVLDIPFAYLSPKSGAELRKELL